MPTPINLPTLPAAVQGADYAHPLQGKNVNGVAPTTANPSTFLSTDTLTATVSLGQGLPSLFSPTVTWFSAPLAQVTFQITGAQSATLAIDGVYLVNVFVSRGGVRYCIVAGYLPVLPSAGSQTSAAPPDLVTIPYAARLLGILGLGEPQLECVPSLITGASAAIRTWCVRLFTQANIVENVQVELDGSIRLAQIPISTILRVQSSPVIVLTIANATAASSWVNQIATGDPYSGLVITGLTLNWESSGTIQIQPVNYTTGMTIAQLATAIAAVGQGWTATADSTLGVLPVGELFDLASGDGAGPDDAPDNGAAYHAYSANIKAWPHPDEGEKTGIYYVANGGRLGGGIARGGGWVGFFGDGPYGGGGGAGRKRRVKVSYVGGFVTVPPHIQIACVELVKLMLSRLQTDLILRSERGDKYAYDLALEQLVELPDYIMGPLNRSRISNA